MFRGLLLLCVLAVAYTKPSAVELQDDSFRLTNEHYEAIWKQFKFDFGKLYKDELEEQKRYSIFLENIHKIEEHNNLYSDDVESFSRGINQFTDMTLDEYKDYNRLRVQYKPRSDFSSSTFKPDFSWKLPGSVDWRKRGYVTPVKNQGNCGSSWAFSIMGSPEGQHFNRTGKLVSLSEQQLVDCSGKYGGDGCAGGLVDNTFDYIYHAGGLESEKDYPYKGLDLPCKFNKSKAEAHVKIYVDVLQFSEEALQHTVATVGPVSVVIDASLDTFGSYSGGVYYDRRCRNDVHSLNHAMLVTGYGTYKGKKYWMVKSSFGTKWGHDGYIMMSRDRNNNCGIASLASIPISD